MKPIKDKLIIGLVAGITGSVIKDLFTIISELVLRLHPSYWDYGSYLLFQRPIATGKYILPSILAEVFFGTFLSVAYVYIKKLIPTKYSLLRGTLYGVLIWGIIRCIVAVFDIYELKTDSLLTVGWNWATSGIYGLVVGYIVKRLEK